MAIWGPTEVAHTNDDCRYITGGTVSISPADSDGQHLGLQGGQIYHVAFRFANVTILNGATIDSAELVIQVGYESLGTGQTIIAAVYAFDVDDCPNFNTGASGTDPNDHDKTTANIAWNWDDTVAAGEYASPDIKTVIKEIVDRGSWASGNAIGLVLFVSAADSFIQIEDVEGAGAGQIATLEIEYTAPAGGIVVLRRRRM